MTRSRCALAVYLLLVAGCAAHPAEPPRSPSSEGARSTHRASDLRNAGWILVGAGGSVAAVAVGTSAIMLYENGVRDNACDANKACTTEGLQANDRLRDLSPWNMGAWVVGTAAVGGGLALLLTNPKESRSVSVAPGAGGALVTGTF